MKRILAFGGHLLAATLAVPLLTIMASGLAYGVFSPFLTSVKTPQQFYSDHLIFLVVVVGALLSFAMSGTFTGRSALWVWIPAAIVFLSRLLDWRATGSALIGSGSFVEHFFTANCQIQNWREGGFVARCSDKLYVTQLFAGSVAYSAGAAIRSVIYRRRLANDAPTAPVMAMPSQHQIVTTRFGAFLALVLTGCFLGLRFHAGVSTQHSSWTLLDSKAFPTWLAVTFNVAIWGVIYLMGIGFIRTPLQKNEKALFVSLMGSLMLTPVGSLLPRISGVVHVTQTLLSLSAFLAALAILLSFQNEHAGSSQSDNG
ncbi:MAG: hypothetical protein LAO03_02675 [Acidobacteriia bacterium]|nr:hypothetical protein [Terriglobia bacterium]